MTRDKSSFTNLLLTNDGFVTFGGGNKALINRKGSIISPGNPKLEDVLYVEGLKSNHISIN